MWFLIIGLILKYLLWFEWNMPWAHNMTEEAFLKQLNTQRKEKGIGLFGILMLGESDRNAGEVILDEAYKTDIAKVSAEDCWFIYFKPAGKIVAKRNPHHEHAEGVNEVAKWLKLETAPFPYFVFFERPETEEEFIYIPLGKRSKDEIIQLVRELFDYVRAVKQRKHSNYSAFEAVKSFQQSRDLYARVGKIANGFYGIAMTFATELISKTASPG